MSDISVIVTVKNRFTYLKQCLDSTEGSDCEVLVQDNGNRAVLDWPQWSRYRHVNYQANERDLGFYGSVNAAIRRAREDWIHVLCDDDWVQDQFYQVLDNHISLHSWQNAPDSIGAISTHYSNYDQHSGWTSSPPPFRDGSGLITDWLRDALTRGNPLQVCAVVIRRSVFEDIGYFREDLPYAADWEFYARLLTKYDWWYIPQDLARYRQHDAAGYNAMLRDGSAQKEMEVVKALAKQYRERRLVAV